MNLRAIEQRRHLVRAIGRAGGGWRLITNAPVLVRAGYDAGAGVLGIVCGTVDGWSWYVEQGFTRLTPIRQASSLGTAMTLARFRAAYERGEHDRRVQQDKNRRRWARQRQREQAARDALSGDGVPIPPGGCGSSVAA